MNYYEIPKFKTKEEETEFYREFTSNLDRGCYIISSTNPAAGKTTIIKNLANAIIERNSKVLIINSDVINKRADFSDMTCDVIVLTKEECNAETIIALIDKTVYDYIFIDTAPRNIRTSIINTAAEVLSACDRYFYVINNDSELVDRRTTDSILYHAPKRPPFRERL